MSKDLKIEQTSLRKLKTCRSLRAVFLSLGLAVVMLVMFTTTASAMSGTINVTGSPGDVSLSTDQRGNGKGNGTWEWITDTDTLTLTNYDGGAIRFSGTDYDDVINLVINGTATINGDGGTAFHASSTELVISGGELTLENTGSGGALVSGNLTVSSVVTGNSCNGPLIYAWGTADIENGAIITSTSASPVIRANDIVDVNGGTVTAENATVIEAAPDSVIRVNSGTVRNNSDTAPTLKIGALGFIVVSSGTVTNEGDGNLVDIGAGGQFRVRTSGALKAMLESTKVLPEIRVIYASDNITMTEDITMTREHQLYVHNNQTVSTGANTLTLTATGALERTGDGKIIGGNNGKIILNEGAKVKNVDGIFVDGSYTLATGNGAKFVTVAETSSPSTQGLRPGEYVWDGLAFVKGATIPIPVPLQTPPTLAVKNVSVTHGTGNFNHQTAVTTATDVIDGNIKHKVKISKVNGKAASTLSLKKAGTYTIEYTLSNSFGKNATATGIVTVVATNPTLAVKDLTLNYGKGNLNIVNAVTQASDLVDGANLKAKVVIIKVNGKTASALSLKKAGKYSVTYSLKNSNGKTFTVTKMVTVKANAPVLKVKKVTVKVSKKKFKIKSAITQANDTVDGDLKAKVKITKVNGKKATSLSLKKAGTYKVTYTVKNSNGKIVNKVGTVVVKKK
ncbi:hypothetical protein EQG49_04180 [Periweissella cryptocerci]|uniref:DUF5011 domain-containing protein n=1 Tax=Periweissella cryptocerci TaxID=2506420 RepID=A0A4V1AIJ4_9LACO|nr:hypothetical protein [Periweissella cryptocerci]QBO35715.1 hypothetical protein EQG49_04180 [Periweissella cryptocerci]